VIKLTTEPLNKTIEINEGVSLLSQLKSQGIDIKSKCGGHASCSDCIIKMVSPRDCFSAPQYEETKLLGNVFHITNERLACQACALQDAVINIDLHL
jgi:2Fe-2S ferredoxin